MATDPLAKFIQIGKTSGDKDNSVITEIIRSLVNGPIDTSVSYNHYLGDGVSANYTYKEDAIRIGNDPVFGRISPADLIDSVAHEYSHAIDARPETQLGTSTVGDNYIDKFFMDVYPEVPKRHQYKIQEAIVTKAKELGLPSSYTMNFDEVIANATGDYVNKLLGLKGSYSDKLEELYQKFPRLGEYINSGLGSRYRNIPRIMQGPDPNQGVISKIINTLFGESDTPKNSKN